MFWTPFIIGQAALGAVVGAATNWLAIRLLFRPYKAITVFGLRMPFTPSVFVRHQAQLADKLQTILHQRLISESEIRSRFNRTEIRDVVQDAARKHIRKALTSLTSGGESQSEPSAAKAWLSEHQNALTIALSPAADYLAAPIASSARDWLNRPETKRAALDALKAEIRTAIGKSRLSSFLLLVGGADGLIRKMDGELSASVNNVVARAERMLESEEGRAAISDAIRLRLAECVNAAATDDERRADATRLLRDSLKGLGEPSRDALADMIADAVSDELIRLSPDVINAVNLSETIRDRIATWPPDELEAAIVSATGKHLRALTLLGGVIGAILTPIVSSLLYLYLVQ